MGESKRETAVRQPLYEPEDDYDSDLWDESMEPEPYNPPKVNIPEKRRKKYRNITRNSIHPFCLRREKRFPALVFKLH